MSKALYVATVVKTHIMEFHLPYLKLLKDMGWKTAVAARNDYDDPKDCNIPCCDDFYDLPFERNPIKLNNIKTYRRLKKIIDKENYDIIHCHTPMGACIARLAARDARKKGSKVVYTAHGFHFYDGAPIKNWLIYFPVEKWLSKMTDVLITINKEDYERAKKWFRTKQIEYMPGVGIDTKRFSGCHNRKKVREELGIPDDKLVLLSVGELNENKNHEVVIRAAAGMDAVYVIAGQGPLKSYLQSLAEDVGTDIILTGYRQDVEVLYNSADIFVFPSIREGLGLAAVEAMASGLPLIISDNRGLRNNLTEENAITCRYDDVDAFRNAIKLLAGDSQKRNCMATKNIEKSKEFDISVIKEKMEELYRSLK